MFTSKFFWLSLFIPALYCLTVTNTLDQSKPSSDNTGESAPKFIPTKEWQVIPEGVGIPQGLHVRIDMQTGLKEAKLLDEEDKPKTSAIITQENSDASEAEKSPEPSGFRFDPEEIKDALKKIKDEAKQISNEEGKKFRTYEEIKEEMKNLEQAIKTEYEIVKELVNQYLDSKEDEVKKYILDDLEFYVHQYDNALDFVKMGGFKKVVLHALNSSNSELRSSACFLLGSACQSNPKAQIAAIEMGALPQLIRLMSFDSTSQVRNRALYAISGVVRNFPLAQKALVEHGGITAFSEVFATDSADLTKLQLKIVTLLGDLILEKTTTAQLLLDAHKQDAADTANSTAKEMLEEKWRQYETTGIEKSMVDQGFCRLFPRLLTQLHPEDKQTRRDDVSSLHGRPLRDEHDVVEKVIQAMDALAKPCRRDFLAFRQLIKALEDKYEMLATPEKAEHATAAASFADDDHSEMYFTKLHHMCQHLLAQLGHDEL